MRCIMRFMDWNAARCNGLTPAQADRLFFFGRGQGPHRARKFCGGCPIFQQCRDYAILYHERGFWGGMTEDERDSIEPLVRPHLLERARQAQQLEERLDPSAALASLFGPTQSQYPEATESDNDPNTLPPIHSWLQMDESIVYIALDESPEDFLDTGS